MVIFDWIIIILVICGAIGLTIYFCYEHKEFSLSSYKPHTLLKVFVTWLVSISIVSLLLFALYGTESGKRAQKTFHSETDGGLERTVKVYDFEGDLLTEYTGKFDVAENMETGVVKVKFDCDGKRHIIYCSTGTVVIDER